MTNTSPSTNTTMSAISNSVGDYCGYEIQAQRQMSDKNIRTHMISKIKGLLDGLDSVPGAPEKVAQERLDELVKRTKRKLTTVCESLKRPTYSGSVFFNKSTLGEKKLSRIYDFESIMLSDLDGLAEEVTAMKSGMEGDVFENHFLHIFDFVDNLNQTLFEREAAILEIE